MASNGTSVARYVMPTPYREYVGLAIVDANSRLVAADRNMGYAAVATATSTAPDASAANSVGRRFRRVGAFRHRGRPMGTFVGIVSLDR